MATRGLLVLFALATSLLFVLSPVFAASQWKVIHKDFATIAMSNDFVSETEGWVVGASSGMQPLFLYSDDAGNTLTNYGLDGVSNGAFMSVALADAKTGVAGALGFLTGICGAYTTNGLNWTQTHEGKELICVSQSVSAPDDQTFILVGQWSEKGEFNGDGVQISLDGGATFNGYEWNQGTSSRYGFFLNKNFGFVTGGQWPEDDSDIEVSAKSHAINMHYRTDGKTFQRTPRSTRKADEFEGYIGIIAQATNGGQTYQTVLNLTNEGLYFNEISCVDELNCWAVCEGNDPTSGAITAWIYATTDGWSTYEVQLSFNEGSLMAIDMISPTVGFAGGCEAGDNPLGTVYATTDGKTWTLNGNLQNFCVTDMSVVDQNTAFASGITSLGLSSLARYSSN